MRDEDKTKAQLVKELAEMRQQIAELKRGAAKHEQTETALRESEREFQTLLNSITDYVWSADIVRGQVIYRYYSPVVERITGYPPDYFMSSVDAWLSIIHPQDRALTERMLKREFQGEIVVHEYRIIRPDGEVRWLYGTTSPTLNERGEVVRLDGVVSDITEHKQLEEQLRQSQKMEAIGRLAGGIAHDFNNLLTAIISYAELSLRCLPSESLVYHDIQGIHSAAQRAADLTRQLMAFARNQIIQPKVINLNHLIFNLDRMFRRLIGEDIERVTLTAPDLGLVKVDPGQIEQVLVNLVINARDAMPHGGKLIIETVNITLDQNFARQHIELSPGNYVMLSVTDNGIGMTEEVKAHLFEPFFTTKEIGKGTGLGLATCFGIVKQSGGHILADSEPGQGTTFKIYLPRLEEEVSSPLRLDDVDELPQGTETILLVEDEAAVRETAARILREQGYTVLEAANGSEALHMLNEYAEQEVHLLLTDLVMPHMGGKEVADRLKHIRPNARILFMSGYTDSVILRHGLPELGAAFLKKPFSPKVLTQTVREVLDSD
jgi:PAS domain S-box-containing protein